MRAPDTHHVLYLDGNGEKTFRIEVPASGWYALFLVHRPEEFGTKFFLDARSTGAAADAAAARDFAGAHEHDDTVASVGLRADRPVDGARLEEWLTSLLRDKGTDIFRMKGILAIAGEDRRVVFQGVHMLVDAAKDRPWRADELRESTLVFIGRDLDRFTLENGFRACQSS